MQAHRDDVRPFLVGALHDEVDDLLDLFVVERATLLVAPRWHRDLTRGLLPAALDRERDQVRHELQLIGVVLEVLVLEGRLIDGKARQILPGGIALAEAGLAVAIEAEVGVDVAAALDRLLELLLHGDLIAPAVRARVGANHEEREEVAADEREDGEQHPRADQDFPIQVRADLEWVGCRRDRGDVVRRRLLDRLAGRVVLLDQLRPGLLARLHGLLVEDEVADERAEARQHVDARGREDEV